MYDHIGLQVRDIDASVRFYEAALAPLGHVLCSRDESGAGLGPKGKPALWLYPSQGRPQQPTARISPCAHPASRLLPAFTDSAYRRAAVTTDHPACASRTAPLTMRRF